MSVAGIAGETPLAPPRHTWRWSALALAMSWLFVSALMAVHVVSAFGQVIEQQTHWIDYGRDVTLHEYVAGLGSIPVSQGLSRLSLWLMLRLAVFAWLAVRLFRPGSARQRPDLALGSWLGFDAAQFLVALGPGRGLLGWVRAWRPSEGIDGQMFGEDWFSWAASDILLAVSLRVTAGVAIYWLRCRLIRRTLPA